MTRLSTRWVLVALGVVAVVAPGAVGQALGGLPLSVVGLLVLAAVLYAGLGLPELGWVAGRWVSLALAVVVALKLGAAATSPPLGLQASYFASASPDGAAAERSTDFAWLANATRIDRALDQHGEDFAVHFFNDASRFNFGPDAVPARDQLPFSVRWQGWLLAPSDGERRFVLESNGTAQAWLDDTPLAADGSVELTGGLHVMRIEYTRPEARVPSLHLSWQREPGAPLETLAAPDGRWQPSAASPLVSAALGTAADLGLAAAVLAWLALGLVRLGADALAAAGSRARAHARGPTTPAAARRIEAERHTDRHTERHVGVTQASSERHLGVIRTSGVTQASSERHVGVTPLWRAVLAGVPVLFLAYGMLLEAPAAGRASILSGLDDWLVYESSARDILLNGLLMSGGQGHAAPFYGQPLYPYVLALAHRLTGESVFGPIVLQYAALGGVLVGTALLARRAFGTALDGLVALASLLVLLQLEPEHFKIARQLFNENLYMPLVMASLIVLVWLARRSGPPSWWHALLAGLLLGVTAISRTQFLLCVPFALLVLLLAWRRDFVRAMATLAVIVAGVFLAIAPITARNLMVSGQFVLISSSGGASLLEFHRPPPGLIDPAVLQNDPIYESLHLDQQTRTVLAFVRADPRGYLATLEPLGAHSIGLQGRNDPGIYWALLATVVVYLASFGLKTVRRLHVWPIHAFVFSHLLVLMLFEADTYGYRLVMPMYAPMVAVAAQVPLAVVRALVRSRVGAFMRRGDAVRAGRFAVAGWSVIALAALLWQAKGLVELWPERETALHGLGGVAAHAAVTSDRGGASTIYAASIDGTPRRFGAGNLPGLRYAWFKWFDPVRSLPVPALSTTAVYMLSELSGHDLNGDLTTCLGQPDAAAEVVVSGDMARRQCIATESANGATFDGVARIDSVQVPERASAGDTLDARLVWQPLARHPEPYQVSLQLDDPAAGDGMQWGNGTLELYPARQWQTDETLLSRIPVSTDPTAIPQAYRLTLGMTPTRGSATQGVGTSRVSVGTVTLSPGTTPVGQALPPDMRPVEGPPLIGGGLELIGARALPAEAAVGGPLRLGLLWRAMQDQPSAAQFTLRLVRNSGEVAQEWALPLLGGRVSASTLREGNVVRDEQNFSISARIPSESMALELATGDAAVRLGNINLTGRAHVFDAPSESEATFGDGMELVADQVAPARVAPGAKVTVKLRWRSAAELPQAYKVFVHVLDPAGQQVVAQRDAEPQDGRAPTTGWIVGEVIEDEYVIALPTGIARGDYPLEIGVYDPRSGDRLRVANGENRLVLNTRLAVTR